MEQSEDDARFNPVRRALRWEGIFPIELPGPEALAERVAEIARERTQQAAGSGSPSTSTPTRPTWTLLAGYLSAWTIYGLVAYGLDQLIRTAACTSCAGAPQAPYVAGGVVILAGLYEFTSLKNACLRTCRTPLQFILHRWRESRSSAFLMGVEHGAVCVGRCWSVHLP